jgi:hypothetical protein
LLFPPVFFRNSAAIAVKTTYLSPDRPLVFRVSATRLVSPCRTFAAKIVAAVTISIIAAAASSQSADVVKNTHAQSSTAVAQQYAALPLAFEPNVGQTTASVDSIARGPGYAVYVSNGEMLIALQPRTKNGTEPARGPENTKRKRERGEGDGLPVLPLQFKLCGANTAAEKQFAAPLAGEVNYLRGNDPAEWHSGVRTYEKLQYAAVYPGVDLIYHGNQRQLEHDFNVAPGANAHAIEWEITGADRIEVDPAGDLLLHTSAGVLRMAKAVGYQVLASGRVEVPVSYELRATNRVGFAVGAHDSRAPLVIDPVLYYSTFLGGLNYDEAYGIAVDSAGNAYVTGVTYSTNFPLVSARQSVKAADGDAFVTKINPAGSALVFSTYLGGNGYDEGDGIAVDGGGNVYVAGVTFSTNFPLANANQLTNGGHGDAFLAKLSSDGASLIYSTYRGSTGYDQGNSVAVAGGLAYLGGSTEDPQYKDADGFVAKFSANGATLVYNTLVGGSGSDTVYGIAVDPAGSAYVTGDTESSDFPVSTTAADKTYGGDADAFVTKLNAAGTAYLYSTYVGGSRTDRAYAIALDSTGHAFITGETHSSDFPLVTPFQNAMRPGGDAFVAKVNPNGSTLAFSTFFGGSTLDYGTGIAVDPNDGGAHITGYTSSTDFPMLRRLQNANNGGGDAFVARFHPAGNTLIYSTLLGGKDTDYANAIAVDSSSVSYLAGYTVSPNYPVYLPLQSKFAGVADAFVTKIGNPVITVEASDPIASEPGTNTGLFTFRRTGNPALALTVNFRIGGTATNGTDYNTIPVSITFPAASTSTTLLITPKNDQIWEGDETVILTLLPNDTYTVGTPGSATVTIVDDEVKPTVTIEATDNNASEPGTNTGLFTITRNTSTVGPLTVKFVVTGTAGSGIDYTKIGTSVTIPAGSSSTTVKVTPIDDTLVEGDETVVATLSASSLYVIGSPGAATVTIADNESPPTVTISPFDTTAAEPGTDTARFRVARTGGTGGSLSVSYAIAGTATNGTDYITLSGTVTIPTGSSTADIVVTPKDDAIAEGNESVVATLVAGAGYVVGTPKTATVTIIDDETGAKDQTVTVQATVATAPEPGPSPGQLTFTRVGSTANSLVVNYNRSGTATSNTDYTISGSGSNSVTIPAGADHVTVNVTPIDDLVIEGNETATVTLVADVAYTIGQAKTATVTIVDDDTVKPTVTVAASDATASEAGQATGTFTFTRNGGSLKVALTVNYAMSGTASNHTDYTGANGSVVIPANSTTATATITPVDDLAVEGNETVVATVSTDSIYTVGSPNAATVTIADNDGTKPTVTVTASDADASEPGTNTGAFTFTRAGGDTSIALTVYFTVSGTAKQFTDYSGIGSSVDIPAGNTSTTVTLTPSDDLIIEGDETATLTIDANSLYTVGTQNSATVTIADNDSTKPTVKVSATDATASEPGADTGTFTFTRTGGDLSVALDVYYTVSGTAKQFTDYSGLGGWVSIPANRSTATVTLSPYNDLVIESSETATVTIDTNSLYTVGTPDNATVTIADNDTTKPAVTLSVTDSSASEANTDTGEFTVTRTGGETSVGLYVYYSTGGTATRFSDYSGLSDYVYIPPNQTTATVTVSPYDDLKIEGTETVSITLTDDPDSIYLLGTQKTGTVNLADDDTVEPTMTVVATDANAAEPGATINKGTFTFTRSGGNLNVYEYVYFTVSGTATEGTDYSYISDYAYFPAGTSTTTVTIDPIDDTTTEGTETAIVTITTDADGIYHIGNPSSATVNISD